MKTRKNAKKYSIPDKDKDIIAVIDVRSIESNLNHFREKSKTDIMPVLKADAYGHGLVDMAALVRKLGAVHIGVATVGEAILLRNSGDIGRILAWQYDIHNSIEMTNALEMDIDIAIYDESHIPLITKLIPNKMKAKVTLFIDTGFNRASIPYQAAQRAAISISKSNKFELIGLMSHLISSQKKNCPVVNEQLRKFRALREALKEINIVPPLVHIANTDACLNYDVSDFSISRVGIGLYGITHNNKISNHLKLTTTIKTKIIQIKMVEKGEGIGYNSTYIARKNINVSLVPIGYADFIPMKAASKLNVYVNGSKRKVLGSINMDQIAIEAKLSDKNGDEVIIIGNGLNCPQTIFDLAKVVKNYAVEILCHLGNRVNRVYV